MKKPIVAVVAACLSLLALAGCGQRPLHVAVVADAALYEVLADVHAVEQRVLCGAPSCAGITARVTPEWTDARSQAFNKTLLPAVEGGRQLNEILAEWQPGEPVPERLHGLITGLSGAVAAVAREFPPGPNREALLEGLARAQTIALSALDLALTVAGGGQ